MAHQKILILDFGSQYTQLIARRVREANVYCELHSWDVDDAFIREFNPAGVILSVTVIPFISSVMRDVFEVVPPVLKESAYGIGCTTWEVVWNVVLPYTKVGVVGGIMLGLGRALGETMAVTFVIGNAYRISASLFAPGNSIASALANEFNEAADPVHRASLIALGLVLFVLTFIVLALSRMLIAQLAKGEGRKT